jgi:osmoprotectant transport system permease protein
MHRPIPPRQKGRRPDDNEKLGMISRARTAILLLLVVVTSLTAALAANVTPKEIKVGSKKFTESVILGEMATELARHAGVPAIHHRELGGTRILWGALLKGDIDIYPEYTGTISEEILAGEGVYRDEAIRKALAKRGIGMTAALGFNNTYAIGMREDRARSLHITKISDLRKFPDLKFGFGNEFMDRADGWPSLRRRYRLPQKDVRGMDHDLGYRGLMSGSIDVMDLYATDAEISYYHLRVLKDDLRHFPMYNAVFLYRNDLERRASEVVAALRRLEGKITAEDMTKSRHVASPPIFSRARCRSPSKRRSARRSTCSSGTRRTTWRSSAYRCQRPSSLPSPWASPR